MAARQNIPAQLRLKEIQIRASKAFQTVQSHFLGRRQSYCHYGDDALVNPRLFMPLPVVTNPGIKPQRKTTDFQISLSSR